MLAGKVRLDRFDKNFRLLERHEQPMRSFTKQFIDMLYVSHAQLLAATAYPLYDVDKTLRYGSVVPSPGLSYRNRSANFGQVAAPAGFTPVAQLGATLTSQSLVAGCDIGIQVGNVVTAPTPTDNRMARRIGHGVRAADVGDATFDSYDVNDDSQSSMSGAGGAKWLAAPFSPRNDYRCSSVEIKIWKTLAPPDLTVDIVGVDVKDASEYEVPHATVLATGTIASGLVGASPGAFVACNFGTAIDLYAGHRYFIVLHCAQDAANYYNWRYDTAGGTYDRYWAMEENNAYNSIYTSSDSGVTWGGVHGSTYMFRVIGRSIGEFEHGGTEVIHSVIADPNANFDIRKFFYNRSGGAINVNEVGIQAYMYAFGAGAYVWSHAFPILIARDTLGAPIAVANTEILLVTYTVGITV